MELRRQKNAATVLVFPILNTTGTHVTGAAGLTASRTAWTDTTSPSAFANLTNATPVEISSRGVYYVTVTSTEMNSDYVYIYVTTTTAGSIAQNFLLNTKPIHSVTSVDWSQLYNKTATINLTGTSINSVSTVLASADLWSVALPGSYTSGQAGYIVGNVASTVTVAGAVWDVARSAHTTAGTFGQGVASVQGSLTGAVASVTAAVGVDWSLTQNKTATVNLTGTSINSVSSAVTAGAISDSAISSTTAVSGFYNQAADMLLGRNLKSATSGGRTVSQALARLRNRQAVSGGTFTQYDTDDATALYTATISTTTASSLTNMDPT